MTTTLNWIIVVLGVVLILPTAAFLAIWWWNWTAEAVDDLRVSIRNRVAVDDETVTWIISHVVVALVAGIALLGWAVDRLTG